MMSETIKVKYFIQTDMVGSRCEGTIEIEREIWESMTAEQQEAEVKEYAFGYLDWGFEEVG